MQPPKFSDDFRRQFRELLAWRRDVRRFRRQPIDPVIFGELLGLACLAPSVGNSQPWRFVLVEDPVRRERIRDIFLQRCRTGDVLGHTRRALRSAEAGRLAGGAVSPGRLRRRGDGRRPWPGTTHDARDAPLLRRGRRADALARGARLRPWSWLGLDPRAAGSHARARGARGLVPGRLSLRRLSRGGARGPRARAPRLAGPPRRRPRSCASLAVTDPEDKWPPSGER